MSSAQGSYRAVARALSSGADPTWLIRMLDFIDARLDLADQRLMVVLALRLAGKDDLPDDLLARIDRTLLGFRYALEDPGDDSMCTWTENHQAMFAVGEFLAGGLHEQTLFSATGLQGAFHRDRARAVLLRWLEDRFRYGFSEWLSGTFYELDIAALTLLIEHADDDELATRASMVLDLMVLDLALHRFEGRFIASAGRANRKVKMNPEASEINAVLAALFGRPPDFDPQTVAAIVIDRSRYEVPAALAEVAAAPGEHRIHSSHGRMAAEVIEHATQRHSSLKVPPGRDELVRQLWSMQAFTLPETLSPTLQAIDRLRLERNRLMAPLAKFIRFGRPGLARTVLAALHPITRGVALQRANVFTHRTPHHLLSSVQSYLPGEFGDQQHLWHAALPGDLSVFATHPGATALASDVRVMTPSAWVGNGVNPDVGQYDNVVVVLHDLRVRRGFLESTRHQLSHLYFPFAKFDETTVSARVLTGRKGDSFIGVVSLEPMEMVSEDEVLQRGLVTGWAVVLSDRGQYSSLPEFTTTLKAATLAHSRDTLRFTATVPLGDQQRASHQFDLTFKQGLRVDGRGQNTTFGRYRCSFVTADRGSSRITVTGRGSVLQLDWSAGTRVSSPAPAERVEGD